MRVYPLIPGLLKQKQLGPLHVPVRHRHTCSMHTHGYAYRTQGLLSSTRYRSDYHFTSKHFGTDLPPKARLTDSKITEKLQHSRKQTLTNRLS